MIEKRKTPRSKLEQALKALRAAEWGGEYRYEFTRCGWSCPVCERVKPDHDDDCVLAACLKGEP